jgi:hypothetical protein
MVAAAKLVSRQLRKVGNFSLVVPKLPMHANHRNACLYDGDTIFVSVEVPNIGNMVVI